jgi:hypothetical protein
MAESTSSPSDEVHAVAKMFASFASTVGADAKGFRDEKMALQWLSDSSSKPISR